MTRLLSALLALTLSACSGLIPEPSWQHNRRDRQAWTARNKKLADEVPGQCVLASRWDREGNPCASWVLVKCKRSDGKVVYEFVQDQRCAKKDAEVCR